MRHASVPRIWRLSAFCAASSRHQAVGDDLEENTSRREWHSVLVLPVQPPQLPATPVFQVLDEAVVRPHPGAGFNRAAAVLPPQPDRLQMPFAAIRRLHETALNQPLGCIQRTEAERSAIGGIQRDLLVPGRHAGCEKRKGRSFARVPSLVIRLLFTPDRPQLSGGEADFLRAPPEPRRRHEPPPQPHPPSATLPAASLATP